MTKELAFVILFTFLIGLSTATNTPSPMPTRTPRPVFIKAPFNCPPAGFTIIMSEPVYPARQIKLRAFGPTLPMSGKDYNANAFPLAYFVDGPQILGATEVQWIIPAVKDTAGNISDVSGILYSDSAQAKATVIQSSTNNAAYLDAWMLKKYTEFAPSLDLNE